MRKGDQLTPANASAGYGIYLDGKKPVEGTPHVVVWEDFQCPACQAREEAYGPVLEQLVAEGKVTAEFRMAHFLDGQNPDGTVKDGGASHRAAMAAAAADQVGHFREYHKVIFANQKTSRGYSDTTLRDKFTEQAGITGDALAEFKRLYNSQAFWDFTVNQQNKFNDDQIGSTPTYLVSGKKPGVLKPTDQ